MLTLYHIKQAGKRLSGRTNTRRDNIDEMTSDYCETIGTGHATQCLGQYKYNSSAKKIRRAQVQNCGYSLIPERLP